MKWDRLFLIVASNIFIAGAIIAVFASHDLWGASFLLGLGVLGHIHFWKGGRIIIRLEDKR